MCNDNQSASASAGDVIRTLPILDRPFHKDIEVVRNEEVEKFFTEHHKGEIAFHTLVGETHTITIGPFEIDITITKQGNQYAINVVVYFKVGPFKKKIYEFSITLPFSDKCVCHSFNVLGIIKATFCFCLENGCIYFTYNIQSVAGNWSNKIKLVCF